LLCKDVEDAFLYLGLQLAGSRNVSGNDNEDLIEDPGGLDADRLRGVEKTDNGE
jgi:hypothetical protein